MTFAALEIYLEETDQWNGRPLYAGIIELARKEGLAGATAYRGIMGFGESARMHSMHVLDISEDLPIVIRIMDEPQKIADLIEKIRGIAEHAKMVTWQVESLA